MSGGSGGGGLSPRSQQQQQWQQQQAAAGGYDGRDYGYAHAPTGMPGQVGAPYPHGLGGGMPGPPGAYPQQQLPHPPGIHPAGMLPPGDGSSYAYPAQGGTYGYDGAPRNLPPQYPPQQVQYPPQQAQYPPQQAQYPPYQHQNYQQQQPAYAPGYPQLGVGGGGQPVQYYEEAAGHPRAAYSQPQSYDPGYPQPYGGPLVGTQQDNNFGASDERGMGTKILKVGAVVAGGAIAAKVLGEVMGHKKKKKKKKNKYKLGHGIPMFRGHDGSHSGSDSDSGSSGSSRSSRSSKSS